ncbi:MAG TPA: CDP-alcohol phosphatidyltransferase family protein [Candidatus Acidoferrum sp.]|nr:CDP-alcohol phosphatidyltransferase family protein [Candidatus Acidoferrum sp.]
MDSGPRRELFVVAVAGVVPILLPSLLLHHYHQLLPALPVLAFVWLRAWQLRDSNRRSEHEPPLTTLGWANRLTLLRGWLLAVCAGYVWPAQDEAVWIPALCYTLAVLLDGIDGMVARRNDQVTLLGTQLDTSMDALGLLVAPGVAIMSGKLHVTYLAVSAAYYLFIGGLHWRQLHARETRPLRPSRWRRALAGLQMAVVAIALWPVVPPLLSQTVGFIAMLPFLAGFWRDWLDVSARR